MSASGQSLLIVHQGAIGDFLIAAPAIFALRKRFQHIDALCHDKVGKLAAQLRIVDRYFPLESSIVTSLFSDSVDKRAAALLTPYSEIILFSFSKALKDTIQQTVKKSVCRISPRPDPSRSIHVTRHLFTGLLESGRLDRSDYRPDFCLPFRACTDITGTKPKIILHPGSGSKKKQWPIQNFIKLSEWPGSQGLDYEFILGPAEHAMKDFLIGHRTPVTISDDLTELTVRLKKATGFIGNDSGVTHLAALLGLPTVAVFGPSDPKRWHPIGRAVEVVRSEPDCPPCFETGPPICSDRACLDRTTPEMVWHAFERACRRAEI